MDYTISLSFALLLVLIWALKMMDKWWWKPKKIEQLLRRQGLKGTKYKLWGGKSQRVRAQIAQQPKPINLSQDIVPHAMPLFHHLTQKFGKVCFYWYKTTPRVVLSDPEMVREVLLQNEVFTKEYAHATIFVSGLAFHQGEKWVKHRKILNPAFHLQKLKVMLPAMTLCCDEMIAEWEKMVGSSSCEIDVWPFIEKLAADVISRTAFNTLYEQGEVVFQLLKQQIQLFLQLAQLKWRWFQIIKFAKIQKLRQEIKDRIRDIIVQANKEGGEATKEDLLGLLLESNSKEIEEHKNKDMGMSFEDVIDECKLFYFAGQETTANFLVWTIIMLGQHQEWQIRAREEVLQVFGKETPHFEGLHHLKIMSMIFHEVLRLYSPAVRIKRITKHATKLGDINLPGGVEVEIPILLIHHDKDLWGDDVKEFKPDRFAEGVAMVTKNKPIYMPFSSGPRVCIGQNFSMVEGKMAIARILQHFAFELSPAYDHAPFPLITLKPRCGAKLILHKI